MWIHRKKETINIIVCMHRIKRILPLKCTSSSAYHLKSPYTSTASIWEKVSKEKNLTCYIIVWRKKYFSRHSIDGKSSLSFPISKHSSGSVFTLECLKKNIYSQESFSESLFEEKCKRVCYFTFQKENTLWGYTSYIMCRKCFVQCSLWAEI